MNGLIVSNHFDSWLRRTNVTLLNGTTSIWRTTNGYDGASRLTVVSDKTNTATYSYLANSSLVGQITFSSNTTVRMTTTKKYDFLNRLTSISSDPSNSYAYLYNAANQRTMTRLADSSYWNYNYDSLGQVISGNKYWVDETPVAGQQFDYTFDTIGNRVQTEAGGDQNGANLRVAYYTNNSLNQITGRTVPGYVDIMGIGIATNPVSVNGTTAYRKNEYFRDQLSAANTSAAVWDSITITNGGTTNTGHLYVAETPELYTYDADGNLMSDGRWNYTWDGENRLLSMTSLSGAPSGSQLQLNFTYDYMSRRVQKLVSTNNGSSYLGEYTNKYAYDGWNCLAVMTPTFALSNSFTWGLDLSGSPQGAGGVGGLLAENIGASGVQFVAYDGNGNVSALISASNGVTVANYEYGPFGEVIRATGPMAKFNPFRFSTKYDDDETDLLYYGYRYYNPTTGRWLSRDPLGDSAFCGQYLANLPDGSDDEIDRILLEALQPSYLFSVNNPINSIDQFGLDAHVPDCTMIIYLGHNYSVPQGTIYTGVCSAAAVVSCGKSQHSDPGRPTKQIPGTSPTPPGQTLKVGAAAEIAYEDWKAGIAYAKSRCSNPGCRCKCSSFKVTVEFDFGADVFGAAAANLKEPEGSLNGLTQIVTCPSSTAPGSGGASPGTNGGSGGNQ